MRAQDIMTRDPACCTPGDSSRRAAELMRQHDCGAIPVVESEDSRRVVGMITDRDIAMRGVAEGRSADAPVDEVMTHEAECCSPDDDIAAVEGVMKDRQVRRVPIIDASGALVGIIAQADLALDDREDDREVARVVERVSEPRRPVRPAQAD